MIQGYADHAANGRARTSQSSPSGSSSRSSIFFLLSLLDATSVDPIRRLQLERLSGPSTPYQGLALIVVGIVLLTVATMDWFAQKGSSRT